MRYKSRLKGIDSLKKSFHAEMSVCYFMNQANSNSKGGRPLREDAWVLSQELAPAQLTHYTVDAGHLVFLFLFFLGGGWILRSFLAQLY